MRFLRSRVIDDTNSSTSTITNVEESSNAQEQSVNKRKTKKVKTKKITKRTSEDNEDEQAGKFVLLKYRKSMTVHKHDECVVDTKNQSTDSQKSVNDNIGTGQSRNVKRKKRKTKRSVIEDFCPTFENAITSTIIKSKKEIKIFSTSPANQNASAIDSKGTNSSTEKHIKVQKKNKSKQKTNKNKEEIRTNKSNSFLEIEKQDNFVKASKPDVTNNSGIIIDNTNIIDNTMFDADNAKAKETQNVSTTMNKNANPACSINNNGTFEVDNTESNIIITNVSIANMNQKSSPIDNSTFEIEDSFKYQKSMQSIYEHSAKINDGTFEVEEKQKNQKKNESEHACFTFGNENSADPNKSSFRVNKTSSINRRSISEQHRSALINHTFENEDKYFEDKQTPPNARLTISDILIENQKSTKEYIALDDISDLKMNLIIDISDDTSMKSNMRQSIINLSDEESDETCANKVEGKSETFDVSLSNQSGEWQVQDLTKSIKEETFVDKTRFATDVTFAGNSEAMDVDHNVADKKLRFLNDTTNVLTPTDKSARKKWQKFARYSTAANSVLAQINSPQPKKELFSARKSAINPVRALKNASIQRYSSPAPDSSRKTLIKNKSLLASSSKLPDKEAKSTTKNTSVSKQETSKGVARRIAMPNFALIHQKAFDKMESLHEYSERKRQRAKLLLSINKSQHDVSKVSDNKENSKMKSARELFGENSSKDHNRFGFNVKDVPPKKPSPIVKQKPQNPIATTVFKTSNLPKPKLIIPKSMMFHNIGVPNKNEKAPIFERKDVQAIANKKRVENGTKNRENRREQLKGVRTNRRFELLMKMRNNQ